MRSKVPLVILFLLSPGCAISYQGSTVEVSYYQADIYPQSPIINFGYACSLAYNNIRIVPGLKISNHVLFLPVEIALNYKWIYAALELETCYAYNINKYQIKQSCGLGHITLDYFPMKKYSPIDVGFVLGTSFKYAGVRMELLGIDDMFRVDNYIYHMKLNFGISLLNYWVSLFADMMSIKYEISENAQPCIFIASPYDNEIFRRLAILGYSFTTPPIKLSRIFIKPTIIITPSKSTIAGAGIKSEIIF